LKQKSRIDLPLFLSKLRAAFYKKGDLEPKNTNYKLVIVKCTPSKDNE
jgi:hypothetical protein